MAKAAKAGKQVIIDSIIEQIEKGESRGKTLGIIGNKWEISRTTFDRYWKTANEQHSELQGKAKEAADKAYIETMADAAKEAIMSLAERQKVLTEIARGQIPLQKAMVVNGVIKYIDVIPDWMDRKSAISELNKIDGSYAPTKVANTDKDGNDVPYTITLNLSN